VPCFVRKSIVLNALRACSGADIDKLEKGMFMALLTTYIKCFMNDLIGFVQTFFGNHDPLIIVSVAANLPKSGKDVQERILFWSTYLHCLINKKNESNSFG
jgi:hypothetical protein